MNLNASFKLSVFLLICSISLAQESKSNSAYPKRDFKHQDKITSEVKIEDGIETTYVFLGPVFVEASASERTSIRFDASFQYEGKTPVKPKHISLSFFSVYPECKIPFKPGLTLVLDGESLPFDFSFKSWRQRKPDEEGVAFSFSEMKGDRCHEFVVMFISQKNFLRLVNSRNVEVQINHFKFKINEANLEALRDLASRMAL